MNISLVPAPQVRDVWPVVEPMLQRAIDADDAKYDTIDIFGELLTGEQTLWIAFDEEAIRAVCTVRLIEYPKVKVLQVDFAAGENVDEWLFVGSEVFRNYAKDTGCALIEANGRPGWERRINKMGGRKVAVTFRLDV